MNCKRGHHGTAQGDTPATQTSFATQVIGEPLPGNLKTIDLPEVHDDRYCASAST